MSCFSLKMMVYFTLPSPFSLVVNMLLEIVKTEFPHLGEVGK